MQLVVNTRGAYIGKVDERFQVTVGGVKQEFPSKNVEKILVTTSVALTTDALKLAMDNNIDVVFLEYSGKPFGRVWHSKLGSITTIRRNQLKLTEHSLGTEFVKQWIGEKIDNQVKHLQKLMVSRSKEKAALIQKAIDDILKQKQSIQETENVPIAKVRNIIEGHEGTAGRIYFKALGEVIPKQYEFSGRSKNPAIDMFNCMLNYAYGILYSNVERACIIGGLDPYIGIMHTDNYNKTALTFDLIEMYRGYMDEIVFSLFSKRQVKQDMFDKVQGGLWLNKEGKQLLIEAINKRFEDKIKYRGRMIALNNIIEFDCHTIANKILTEVS